MDIQEQERIRKTVRARLNAQELKVPNAAFRPGEIEHLPVADNSADIVMSNCVIHKQQGESR